MPEVTTRWSGSILVTRLPPELKAELRAYANDEGISMNTAVVEALAELLRFDLNQDPREMGRPTR